MRVSGGKTGRCFKSIKAEKLYFQKTSPDCSAILFAKSQRLKQKKAVVRCTNGKRRKKIIITCTSSTKMYFPPKPETSCKTNFADAGVAKRCTAAKCNGARRGELLPTLCRRPAEPSRTEPLRQGCPLRERGRRSSSPLPAGDPHFEARRGLRHWKMELFPRPYPNYSSQKATAVPLLCAGLY